MPLGALAGEIDDRRPLWRLDARPIAELCDLPIANDERLVLFAAAPADITALIAASTISMMGCFMGGRLLRTDAG